MALPQPQINKDNGCRQMDGKFLPSLQSEPWDTYLHVQFPSKAMILKMKGLTDTAYSVFSHIKVVHCF